MLRCSSLDAHVTPKRWFIELDSYVFSKSIVGIYIYIYTWYIYIFSRGKEPLNISRPGFDINAHMIRAVARLIFYRKSDFTHSIGYLAIYSESSMEYPTSHLL